MKNYLIIVIILLAGFLQISEASYSFRIIVKYPFLTEHYEEDSIGNVVLISDSLARFMPIYGLIFKTETESLYQQSVTNDSGCAVFSFDRWQDESPVVFENILRMAIDFPNTDRVIRIGDKITFEHLKYPDIDFRRSPDKIEIILPMTVTKDEFTIGSASWLNVCTFAVMNDMHIGDGFTNSDFGTNGWDDDTIAGQTNAYIQNDENIVEAINNLAPDFVVVLGDITNSVEWSELQKAKCVLSKLEVPYIPIIGNHDTRPYTDDDGEAGIPDETYFGKYFYDAFAGIYDTCALRFANWIEGPYFSTVSPPDYNTYYLNSAFNYQNYQFINVDYNSRRHAQWPFGDYGTLPEADVGPPPNHLLGWITNRVDDANNYHTKLFCLGHQPLISRTVGGYHFCYSRSEIARVSNAGLKNNNPLAYWMGGHVHGVPCSRIDTTYYPADTIPPLDTVAIVFTLNNACKDGTYGYVQIYDKAKATIVHTPSTLPLPVTIKFQANYQFIDNAYAPYNYHWDFGDGHT